MNDIRSHKDGWLETVKFAPQREKYYENLVKIFDLGHDKLDYIHHFPAFVGTQTLNRNLFLYEMYKLVSGIAGHIAEVGVYKGAGSLFFGKLIQIFEPNSLTMVHGFDHFKGTDSTTDSPLQIAGGNLADEVKLRKLVSLQGLENTVKIHNLNAITGFPDFFRENPHLQFKLIFLDSGTYEVTKASIWALWPHLLPGGIMIFDQFNNEVAPGETKAVRELLPQEIIRTIPNSWMPHAYVIKGSK